MATKTASKQTDIVKILKAADRKELVLYCSLLGDVVLKGTDDENIRVYRINDPEKRVFTYNKYGFLQGLYVGNSAWVNASEPSLFPSSEQRSWDRFYDDLAPELPSSWEKYVEIDKETLVKSKDGKFPYAAEVTTLQKLLILRDYYNKIYPPVQKNGIGYSISKFEGDSESLFFVACSPDGILMFHHRYVAEKFLKSFRDMIKEVSKIINI